MNKGASVSIVVSSFSCSIAKPMLGVRGFLKYWHLILFSHSDLTTSI